MPPVKAAHCLMPASTPRVALCRGLRLQALDWEGIHEAPT